MDKFLIVTNQDKDKDLAVTKEIQRYIIEKGRDCQLAVPLNGTNPVETGYTNMTCLQEDIDCVIVLGGDGTFIQTVRDFAGLDIPMVGINMGTVGFLTTIELEELHDGLDALIEGDYTIQNRMLLRGKVYRDGRRLQKSIAFNDHHLSFREHHWPACRKIITCRSCRCRNNHTICCVNVQQLIININF